MAYSASVVDRRSNRRFAMSSGKWFWMLLLLVSGFWVADYLHATVPVLDNEKSSKSNFEIMKQVPKLQGNIDSSSSGRIEQLTTNGENISLPREPMKDYSNYYTRSDDPTTLTIMSWNIFGKYQQKIQERAHHVIKTVLREKVDAVFFQEMYPPYYKLICKALRNQYVCIKSTYHLATLFKKSRFEFEGHEAISFSFNSSRVLLIAEVSLKNSPNNPLKAQIALFNSHLAAFPLKSQQRKEQFRECMKYGNGNYSGNFTVIFGGDMNLEEDEESDVEPVLGDFKDLWKECGSAESIRYTWDSTKNHMDRDSLTFVIGQKPQVRYDRLYYRTSNPKTIEPINLKLGGTEKVEGTDLFVSDHWALIATFKIFDERKAKQYSCEASS